MADASTDRTKAKRRRIVDAALFLVLRDGFRGTTMQAIASQAGIAKPTLYAQFPDKDAVYAGIVDAVLDEVATVANAGMNGPGTVAERIGAALAGQYEVIGRLLAGSPHASELMSEHKRAGLNLSEWDVQYKARITQTLAGAGVANPDAIARMATHAAFGIAFKSQDPVQTGADIRLMCNRLITPELG